LEAAVGLPNLPLALVAARLVLQVQWWELFQGVVALVMWTQSQLAATQLSSPDAKKVWAAPVATASADLVAW
jgi:hypothetical protein